MKAIFNDYKDFRDYIIPYLKKTPLVYKLYVKPILRELDIYKAGGDERFLHGYYVGLSIFINFLGYEKKWYFIDDYVDGLITELSCDNILKYLG